MYRVHNRASRAEVRLATIQMLDTRQRTSVNDPMRVQVLDRAHNSTNELRRILLKEVRLGADTVEELAALAKVGDEVDCASESGQLRLGREGSAREGTVVLSL